MQFSDFLSDIITIVSMIRIYAPVIFFILGIWKIAKKIGKIFVSLALILFLINLLIHFL